MKKIKILLFPVFFALCVSAFAQEADLKVRFIDVGKGDAILIETPDGKVALVDAGNPDTGFRVVEYLKSRNIKSLGHLIFTHPDPDHIGGVSFILPVINVKAIYDNGQDLTGETESNDSYQWYEQLVRENKNYKILKAGDSISLGEVTLSVLWPFTASASSDFNTNSLVMMLKYGKFRCLLTGDLTVAGERMLLEQVTDLKADVLKVGHHGSDDATSLEFLKWVSPKIAVISVDAKNAKGYPSAKVVERIGNAAVVLYRTDRDGDITLSIYQPEDGEPVIKIKRGKE